LEVQGQLEERWRRSSHQVRREPTDVGAGHPRAGVEIIAWGYNDPSVDRRANYDAFGVYRMPNRALFEEFQKAVAGSGWYDYFEHVNAGGTQMAPPDMLSEHIQLVMPGASSGAGS
jgi:hypothetical protein